MEIPVQPFEHQTKHSHSLAGQECPSYILNPEGNCQVEAAVKNRHSDHQTRHLLLKRMAANLDDCSQWVLESFARWWHLQEDYWRYELVFLSLPSEKILPKWICVIGDNLWFEAEAKQLRNEIHIQI